MAQAAHRIETEAAPASTTETAPVSTAVTEFEAALSALEQAASHRAISAAAMKDDTAAVRAAEIKAAWLAFALVRDAQVSTVDERKALAEALAVRIATARGVKEENMRPQRQRARDAVEFLAAIDRTHEAERAKRSPFTIAKTLREQANASGDAKAARRPYLALGKADALEALNSVRPEPLDAEGFQTLLDEGDAEAHALWDAAIDRRMARAAIIADAYAWRARIADADPETAAAIGAVMAGLA